MSWLNQVQMYGQTGLDHTTHCNSSPCGPGFKKLVFMTTGVVMVIPVFVVDVVYCSHAVCFLYSPF